MHRSFAANLIGMPSLTRMILALLILSSILCVVEWMSFRLLARKFGDSLNWWIWKRTWLTGTAVIWAAFIVNGLMWPTWRVTHPSLLSFLSVTFFVVFLPKLVLAAFQLTDDLRYLTQAGVKGLTGSLRPISRSSFISTMGLGAAGITFASFLHGVIWGKYNYRVERMKVPISGLPSAFEGLRIVQISDAHLGSFSDLPTPVLDALESIASLNPDIILFTGDLVNTDASEAEPWIDSFSRLSAPLGKFSILGNHDYADYGPFTPEEREASRKRIREIHDEMGFRLLLNEHVHIERNGEKMALVGVENWGRGFHKKGDLKKAMAGSEVESLSAILMSHDPTHWEEEVMDGKASIELTLSGHTHGLQFGIEIPWLGVKWSPSQWRYKRWGGLYTESNQHLHVNRGFGVLGFHGRVGMPPEITLLELEQAQVV